MPAATEVQTAFYDEIRRAFPWLDQLGLNPTWVQNMLAESTGAAEIVAQIRQTTQYKARFPGLFAADGSMRMTEAQYFEQEQAYRQILRQYGQEVNGTPGELAGIFNSEQDPNELRDRLEVWRGVTTSSQPVKNAFYVYAGINITDEDLYRAVVDQTGYGKQLSGMFERTVVNEQVDYATYVRRATELAKAQAVDKLIAAGDVAGAKALQSIDDNFVVSMMDKVIYDGDAGGQLLSLEEALQAFEFAAIGGAASQAGLEMPTKERLQEIRSYGVDRARAIEGYQSYGPNAALYNAAVQRARGESFGQADFENAAFIGNASAQRALQSGIASEKAAGMDAGQFAFDRGRTGRFQQTGFQRF